MTHPFSWSVGAAALTLCLATTAATATPSSARKITGDPRSRWLNGVSMLSPSDGWAVGNADSFDSRPGNTALRWDGSTWSRVKTVKLNPFGFISDVAAVASNDSWAVGSKDGMALVEHWDGRHWSVATTPSLFNTYLLAATASGPEDAWAVGFSYASFDEVLEHWDGTSWTVSDGAAPDGAGLTDVEATSPTNAWASGHWGQGSPLMEHWDGSDWTWSRPDFGAFPDSAGVNGISSVGPKDAWVAGSYEDADSVQRPFFAHWNGKKWKSVDSPMVTGSISELSMLSSDNAWAVGNTDTGTLTEHWDGTSWHVVDSPAVGTQSILLGVDALAADDVVAVGGYVTATGRRPSLTLHWDGSSWSRTHALVAR